MVAIDEDWSALRFRKAENIKTMTRGFAMSETGKKKVAAEKKKLSKGKGTFLKNLDYGKFSSSLNSLTFC